MDLKEYLQVVRRRWPLIVGIMLALLAAASLLTLQVTPRYKSTTTLFVSSADDSSSTAYQGTLYTAQRVKSYAALATGQDISKQVVDTLDLAESPTELSSAISAEVVADTVLLRISVSDPSPRRARAIAKAVAERLIATVSQLETPPGHSQPIVKASIIDAASLPTRPYSPNIPVNLGVGLFIGLILGLAIAMIRELLDNTINNTDDISKVVEAPVVAHVPFDARTPREPLLGSGQFNTPRGEAFRILRTNMQFIDVDHPDKVVVVTSSVPSEGKTTIAINLAESMAQAGSSVLLIDGDLRRPQVADRLNLEGNVGLTTALVSSDPLTDFLQETTEAGLRVLTAGRVPPNPAELLQTQAMENVLREARRLHDMVIIDAAPLLPVTDAALLAARADGAIVVTRQGKTTRDLLAHAVQRLEAVDGRIFGVVLNMVRVSRRPGGYGYGYGYGLELGYGATPEATPRGEDFREGARAVS